ncbi:hypothetical protein ScPMuIL_011076 [Solemya velum]
MCISSEPKFTHSDLCGCHNFSQIIHGWINTTSKEVHYVSCTSRLQCNASPGRLCILLFISNRTGHESDNAGHTTSEILLVRSGFDCNHSALTSICKNHGGNFGCSNGSYVDEEGQLLGELMFGMNHLMLLSNDSKYGNLSNGVFVKGAVQDELCPLPIKVNDSSTTLILCSGQESGVGSAKPVSCIYMIRSGHSKDVFHSLHVKGDDLWKFSVEKGGILHVLGPSNSFYGLYHNRENLHGDFPDRTQTVQTQAFEGDKACKLLDNVAEIGVAVILCSNSNGTEDSTASSVYVAFLGDGQVKSFAHLQEAGVLFAVNACGPAYEALTGVVYTSEHHQFVNFSYDKLFGSKYKSLGGMKVKANISEILKGTHDGFLIAQIAILVLRQKMKKDFLISAFFSKAKVGSSYVLVLCDLLTMSLHGHRNSERMLSGDHISASYKNSGFTIFHHCVWTGRKVFGFLEEEGVGIQWSNIGQSPWRMTSITVDDFNDDVVGLFPVHNLGLVYRERTPRFLRFAEAMVFPFPEVVLV